MATDSIDLIIDEMAQWAKDASPAPEGNDVEARHQLELLRDYVSMDELDELTPVGLRQLLLSVYPRKVTVVDGDALDDVLPTTRDIVRFAGDTERLEAGTVRDLEREIESIEPEFESTVMDPTNWGMARSITTQMLADGVDPSNSDEMQRWIAAYNSGQRELVPAAPPHLHEVGRALGLPERLVPIRLPPESELAAAARGSVLLTRAAELAAWTGDGRETKDDELRVVDVVAAAESIGIELPGEAHPDGVLPDMPSKPPIKSMRDLPELRQLWFLAVDARLIVLCDGHVHVGDDPADFSDDDDTLGAWSGAFQYVLAGWLPNESEAQGAKTLDFAPAGLAVFTALFLAPEPLDITELRAEVEEVATAGASPGRARKAWRSWVQHHGDPADTLLAHLADLGAVTVRSDTVELTPLGWFGTRDLLGDMGVEVPLLPRTDEMTAAELVDAAAGMMESQLEAEAAAWLDLQKPEAAADELLAIAAAGSPTVRLIATSLATTIGEPSEPQWRAALDRVELRPYAKIALARFAGLDDGEVLPGIEPEPADAAWLLADTVMATVDDDDDDAVLEQLRQAVPPGHEADMFDALWRLPHPDAPDVLSTIGRVHPDKKIAKLARKAAFKARSQAARTPPF